MDRELFVYVDLDEVPHLVLVDDEARQGALRFAEREGGSFLREPEARRIPPLLALPQLLSATDRVLTETDTSEDLQLLCTLPRNRRCPAAAGGGSQARHGRSLAAHRLQHPHLQY